MTAPRSQEATLLVERDRIPECFQRRARYSVPQRGLMFFRGWKGTGSGASREAIRAMHMAGPAPSGDFWFLLVVSKGTRRRQGIWGEVDVEFGFPSWFAQYTRGIKGKSRRTPIQQKLQVFRTTMMENVNARKSPFPATGQATDVTPGAANHRVQRSNL